MSKRILTQSELKKHLHYNPETGVFKRLLANGDKKPISKKVGSSGYSRVMVRYCHYLTHRLAFLYMNGSMPEEVDHINHVKTDNRWINLRPSTHAINHRNRSMDKRNTSGHTGVTWSKKSKKWQATISAQEKPIYLGLHDEKETAITIRKAAECWFGYHENHGNSFLS